MKPLTRFLITLFLGEFGVHKFLDRKIGLGILYLCTFGLFGVGWLVDVISAGAAVMRSPQPIKQSGVGCVFEVAGVTYYMDNIQHLAKENRNYALTQQQLLKTDKVGKPIFKYWYINEPVLLVPEPSNPHDPNAVMVQISGQKVGYISREENVTVLDLLKKGRVQRVESFVSGGEYKLLLPNGSLEKSEKEIHIKVTVWLK